MNIRLFLLAIVLSNFSGPAFADRPGDKFLSVASKWSGISAEDIRTSGLDQSIYKLYSRGPYAKAKMQLTFLKAFQKDTAFKACESAQHTTEGEFVCQRSHGFLMGSFYYPINGLKNGDDQCGDMMTLRQFYFRLLDCSP